MTGPAPQPGRLTLRQAVGWGMAFLVIAALVILFFIYARQVRPALGLRPTGTWLTNLS